VADSTSWPQPGELVGVRLVGAASPDRRDRTHRAASRRPAAERGAGPRRMALQL